jgi:hypothetical protein
MSPLLHRHRAAPLALALAITAALASPAGNAAAQTPPTQVWIDVATHHHVNEPDLGGMGRFAQRMMDRDASKPKYPTTEHPGGTGRYLDVAVHNRQRPGEQVEDAIPAGLGLGGTLVLMPPPPVGPSQPGQQDDEAPDVEFTVHEYWGCGAAVRGGQPRVTTFRLKAGDATVSGAGVSTGQFAPEGDIQPGPAHVLWPNDFQSTRVPESASMVGAHRFTGQGMPASLKFDLDQNADFMPEIALTGQGDIEAPIELRWTPVERAQAYFLQAAQMKTPVKQGVNKFDVVVWSSAEVGGAGQTLVDYLGAPQISRWLKQRVLLPASATSCTVPQGIFADDSGVANVAMLNMAAYGPETHLAYPPRPTDAKRLATWKPEWSVRVRTKSTASLVLGLDEAGSQDNPKEGRGRQLLRGLFKRGT